MLVNSKQILLEAKQAGCSIPAPDFIDLDSARCYVQVAEEMRRPLILSFAQVHAQMGLLSLEEAALIGTFLAKRAAVPVVLHFDHGMDEETIFRAMELGFTSVMLDASMQPFAENVRRTQAVVQAAHAHGVTVEAEIGHVGTGEQYGDYAHTDSIYTTVEEATRFAASTGVDSLAVSIGTAHGVYKNQVKPTLNFERLHELAAAVSVPLVLHGSSGSGEDNLRRCCAEGISKINVFTDFLTGAMNGITAAAPTDYLALKAAANEGMKQTLRHCYALCGSGNGGAQA